MIQTAGWELDPEVELPDRVQLLDKGRPHHFPSFEREEIANHIAHYIFEVHVGDGPYDFVRIHRVVKESRSGKPVKTLKNLFLLPGDGTGFEAAFLLSTLSTAVPADHSVSIYLARNNVDVWGLDMSWTQVPAEVEDLSFMAEWGLQKDVDDLHLAGGVARFVRRFTGHWGGGDDDEDDDHGKGHHGNSGKMNLLGWSRGGMIGYALLNMESQMPRGHRNFGGFIPTDIWYKTETYLEEECTYAADLFMGDDAPTLVWEPVLDWVRSH